MAAEEGHALGQEEAGAVDGDAVPGRGVGRRGNGDAVDLHAVGRAGLVRKVQHDAVRELEPEARAAQQHGGGLHLQHDDVVGCLAVGRQAHGHAASGLALQHQEQALADQLHRWVGRVGRQRLAVCRGDGRHQAVRCQRARQVEQGPRRPGLQRHRQAEAGACHSRRRQRTGSSRAWVHARRRDQVEVENTQRLLDDGDEHLALFAVVRQRRGAVDLQRPQQCINGHAGDELGQQLFAGQAVLDALHASVPRLAVANACAGLGGGLLDQGRASAIPQKHAREAAVKGRWASGAVHCAG
jgi:hypothetical protein